MDREAASRKIVLLKHSPQKTFQLFAFDFSLSSKMLYKNTFSQHVFDF
jgi:hypothetical protein